MELFASKAANFSRIAFVAAALAVATSSADAMVAQAPSVPVAADISPRTTLQTRILLQGFGRGFTEAALRTLLSRAVGRAEAAATGPDKGPARQRWSFVVQTGGDNRPVTLVTAALQDGRHGPVSGSFRTASAGTAPPIVFAEELEIFARTLILRAHQQRS